MAVALESYDLDALQGSVELQDIHFSRLASGLWTMQAMLRVDVTLNDGRALQVTRTLKLGQISQSGRKPMPKRYRPFGRLGKDETT